MDAFSEFLFLWSFHIEAHLWDFIFVFWYFKVFIYMYSVHCTCINIPVYLPQLIPNDLAHPWLWPRLIVEIHALDFLSSHLFHFTMSHQGFLSIAVNPRYIDTVKDNINYCRSLHLRRSIGLLRMASHDFMNALADIRAMLFTVIWRHRGT